MCDECFKSVAVTAALAALMCTCAGVRIYEKGAAKKILGAPFLRRCFAIDLLDQVVRMSVPAGLAADRKRAERRANAHTPT